MPLTVEARDDGPLKAVRTSLASMWTLKPDLVEMVGVVRVGLFKVSCSIPSEIALKVRAQGAVTERLHEDGEENNKRGEGVRAEENRHLLVLKCTGTW